MWVLRDDKGRYFKRWSDYEPATTTDLREARSFDSKEAAKLSEVYRYRQSSFVPVELELAVKNKAA